MTDYPTQVPRPSRKDIELALSSLDFPLEKEEVVACLAAQDRSHEDVLHQVRALPLRTYGSAAGVIQSIELADQRGP
jgi:uncharacterized protein DUF2795